MISSNKGYQKRAYFMGQLYYNEVNEGNEVNSITGYHGKCLLVIEAEQRIYMYIYM